MPFTPHIDRNALERMLGKTIDRIHVETDYDPEQTEDHPHADAFILYLDVGGRRLRIETVDEDNYIQVGGYDLATDEPPVANDARVLTTIEPGPGPDSPAGVKGCTCIDEPGEDPLCKVHGNPEGGVPE